MSTNHDFEFILGMDIQPIKSLIIDNYDSYTYNLYQLALTANLELSRNPESSCDVIKNDAISWDALKLSIYDYDYIIISPGPGVPEKEAG